MWLYALTLNHIYTDLAQGLHYQHTLTIHNSYVYFFRKHSVYPRLNKVDTVLLYDIPEFRDYLPRLEDEVRPYLEQGNFFTKTLIITKV